MGADLRYGLRMLARNPGFSAIAVLAIALGAGANIANFSVADALVWKPVPLPDIDRLADLTESNPPEGIPFSPVAAANFLDWKERSRSFDWLLAYRYLPGVAGGLGSAPERVDAVAVSRGFFEALGAKAVLGRTFLPQEDQPGAAPVAALSEGLWKRRFGRDPLILGKALRLDGQSYSIVGVLGPEFTYCWRFPLSADVWTPLSPAASARSAALARDLGVIGRLKAGVSLETARTEIREIARKLEREFPDTNRNWTVRVAPLRETFVADVEPSMKLVTVLVGFVLLIACLNVANLQLARGTGRSREIAVRLSLGARRWHIVRQLLAESLLLAVAGAALGLLFARWGLHLLRASMPSEVSGFIAGWNTIALDKRALLFATGVALAGGIVSGLAPALQCSRPNLSQSLKEGGGLASGRTQHRTRAVLVIFQVTLATVLLTGALLAVKGFRSFLREQRAFEPDALVTGHVSLDRSRYTGARQVAAFHERLLEHLRAIPGVRSAAIGSGVPFASYSEPRRVIAADSRRERACIVETVSPEYLRTMGIPLRRGRDFRDGDAEGSTPVAIITADLARSLFAGRDPVGSTIVLGQTRLAITGVAAGYRHNLLERTPRPTLFLASRQAPFELRDLEIAVRTDSDPARVTAAIRQAARGADPDQPMEKVKTLASVIREQLSVVRQAAYVVGILGFLAVALAALGAYAVMAWSVVERAPEIGLRMALGAARADVLRFILIRGVRLALVGILAGLPAAWAMARLLVAVLYGVSLEFSTLAAAALALLGAALVACYFPARRAAKIDPCRTLRAG